MQLNKFNPSNDASEWMIEWMRFYGFPDVLSSRLHFRDIWERPDRPTDGQSLEPHLKKGAKKAWSEFRKILLSKTRPNLVTGI